jgi:hypothetical protein
MAAIRGGGFEMRPNKPDRLVLHFLFYTTCYHECVSMVSAATFVLIMLLAVPLWAAAPARQLFTKPGSTLTIAGSNNLHTWQVQSKESDGWIQSGAEFASVTDRTAKSGKIQARMEGSIPVRSLHINEGTAFDGLVCRLLKEDTNPCIYYRLQELTLKDAPKTDGEPYVFDSLVQVAVAGVTNLVAIPLRVFPLRDRNLRIMGETSLKMTDFQITPFKFRLSDPGGSSVKYEDKIELSFDWFLGP